MYVSMNWVMPMIVMQFEEGMNRVEKFNHPTGKYELELTYCGYERCIPSFSTRPHVRNCYLVHYVLEGNGFFVQDEVKYPVGPGEIFVIYPNHVVNYYAPDPKDPWVLCWFGFIGERAPELLERSGFSPTRPVQKIHPKEDLLSVVKLCTDALQYPNTASDTLLQSYLYRIFYIMEVSCENSAAKLTRNGQSIQIFKNAKAFIRYNYMNQISVGDIVKHLKIDRTYCWKIFRQYSGKSPQQYLMEYRIKKAAELIETSSLQLTDIAACVGIPDLYYFSRLFKKIKGIPPSKYLHQNNLTKFK